MCFDFRVGSFGTEVSRVLGGGLVPGIIEINLDGFTIIWYFFLNIVNFYEKWINTFPSYGKQIIKVVKLCKLFRSYGKHVLHLHLVSSCLTAYFSRGFFFSACCRFFGSGWW